MLFTAIIKTIKRLGLSDLKNLWHKKYHTIAYKTKAILK